MCCQRLSELKAELLLFSRQQQLCHLCCNWLSWLGVVKVSGDVELQQLAELPDNVLGSTILILPLELAV